MRWAAAKQSSRQLSRCICRCCYWKPEEWLSTESFLHCCAGPADRDPAGDEAHRRSLVHCLCVSLDAAQRTRPCHCAQIRAACTDVRPDYRPPVTFLVVQKRHHTRLFPMSSREGDKSGNVMPGAHPAALSPAHCAPCTEGHLANPLQGKRLMANL